MGTLDVNISLSSKQLAKCNWTTFDVKLICTNCKQLLDEVFVKIGFCDIQNNQGQGRGHQPKPKAEADNPHW